MITHLLTRIDLSMHSLSKGQKRIALYIEEHYDKAAFMTASKLGETVGVSESTVVRFATELGYAEADPTADIDGLDAGRKVAILASVAFNSRVSLYNVHIEVITKISAKDIRYAKEKNCMPLGTEDPEVNSLQVIRGVISPE